MEEQSKALAGLDEGTGATIPAGTTPPSGEFAESLKAEGSVPDQQSEPPVAQGPPAGYENVPPELWPGPDGQPPQLTPALLKKLRGRYFTVKHPVLACGHKLDMVNQPKNNCGECWAAFFGTHPQLVEVAHQFYQTQGRGPMVGMRGSKFVKMFEKFMALMYQELQRRQKEQEQASAVQEPGRPDAVVEGQPGETATVPTAEVPEG